MATTKKTITQVDAAEIAATPDVPSSVYADPNIDWMELRAKEAKEQQARIAKMQSDLSEQFPTEVERQLKKSGTFLTYIPVSEVITRLNKVLGFDGWSYHIVKCERDALDPDFVVAHVRLDVFPQGDRFVSVSKDGIGGQKIKRTKQGEIVDLGDEFKGAVSDALKKAAQALGIGLYLARTEEAMEATESPTPSAPPIDPEIEELWGTFMGLVGSFGADGKAQLNKFWSSYGGGRPKPTLATATRDDLEALVGECVRISFNGETHGDE